MTASDHARSAVHTPASTSFTDEQLDALARASASPDLPVERVDRAWTKEMHERVYVPLIAAGLVVQSVRPYEPDPDYEVVHYETTEAGRVLLRRTAS
jgi:hypothetical protein